MFDTFVTNTIGHEIHFCILISVIINVNENNTII